MPQPVIDTHVHIWNFDKATYTWLEQDTSILNRTYHITELEPHRVTAGITGGVLVQAANNPEDTDWMLEVATHTPWLKGVVGWLPLLSPGKTAQLLEGKYAAHPYFKGVRHLIHNEADPQWLLQPPVLESLSVLATHGLPYDVVGILPAHLETALEIARRIPQLNLVLDHLNQPPIAAKQGFGRWGELIKEAAACPNIYAKISGLGTTAANPFRWTAADILPYIGFALDQFGEDRCFCGGDWPVSLLGGDYVTTWQAYSEVLHTLLDEQGIEKVLQGNAQRFYHL